MAVDQDKVYNAIFEYMADKCRQLDCVKSVRMMVTPFTDRISSVHISTVKYQQSFFIVIIKNDITIQHKNTKVYYTIPLATPNFLESIYNSIKLARKVGARQLRKNNQKAVKKARRDKCRRMALDENNGLGS